MLVLLGTDGHRGLSWCNSHAVMQSRFRFLTAVAHRCTSDMLCRPPSIAFLYCETATGLPPKKIYTHIACCFQRQKEHYGSERAPFSAVLRGRRRGPCRRHRGTCRRSRTHHRCSRGRRPAQRAHYIRSCACSPHKGSKQRWSMGASTVRFCTEPRRRWLSASRNLQRGCR